MLKLFNSPLSNKIKKQGFWILVNFLYLTVDIPTNSLILLIFNLHTSHYIRPLTIAYSNYSIPTIHSSTNCSCQLSLYKHYQYAFANPTAHNLLPCEIFIYNYSCQIKLYILHETTVS